MTINTEDLLNSILESVGRIDYIHQKQAKTVN